MPLIRCGEATSPPFACKKGGCTSSPFWIGIRAISSRWELDLTLQMPFVLSAVQRALTQAVPIIWKSDQGSHFTSPQYWDLLRDANVQISMDGKGRAIDTIFTERLWRSVKYEEVYVHEYTSPKEARAQLQNYFEFYNGKRLHQALGYQTPAEVYFQKKEVLLTLNE